MLHGRRAELRMLVDRLDAGRSTVIVGEAGVGKTALISAAAAVSPRRCLRGGALATLSWMPYLPIKRALGRAVCEGDTIRVAADVHAAVGDGILVIDDLHWADAATLQLIPMLAPQCCLLLAVRQGDPGTPALLEFLADAGVTAVTAAPLDEQAALAFARELRGDLDEPTMVAVVERAGRNPLLIRELCVTGEPSTSLRLALSAQLRRLPFEVRRDFAVLAAVGAPVSVDRFGPAAAALTVAGLAQMQDGRCTVRHALLGETVLATFSAEELREVHAHAVALVDGPALRARHLLAAGRGREARQEALAAATAATSGQERAQHLRLAAVCGRGVEDDELRLRAAEALAAAGLDLAAEQVLNTIVGDQPELRAQVLLLRGRTRWGAGDADGAARAVAEARSTLAAACATETPIRIDLLLAEAWISSFVHEDHERAVQRASAALALAECDGSARARAHYLLGTALALLGRSGFAEHLEQARLLARQCGDIDVELRASNNLIGAHESNGDHARGRLVARQMVGRAAELGLGAWEHQFRAMQANLLMLDGEYGSALDIVDAVLGGATEPRTRDQLEVTRTACLIDLGQFDEAWRQIERSLRSAAPDAKGRLQFRYLAADAELCSGRPERALQRFDELSPELGADGELALFTLLGRSRALALWGRSTDVVLDGELQPFFRAVPTELRAHALAACEQWRAAVDLFDRAAAEWRPHHFRSAIYCAWQAAEAQRHTERHSAIPRLEVVEQRAAAHGLTWLVANVRRSLRRCGVRRTAPRRPGVGDLSGREVEIIELIGIGLTNADTAARLGLTRRTVETLVASAAAKLDAHSRVELVARFSALMASSRNDATR
jgi:DNA-binding CsgD family transcriptional regulator/tetratricopeptide (TPR) repeat protein